MGERLEPGEQGGRTASLAPHRHDYADGDARSSLLLKEILGGKVAGVVGVVVNPRSERKVPGEAPVGATDEPGGGSNPHRTWTFDGYAAPAQGSLQVLVLQRHAWLEASDLR